MRIQKTIPHFLKFQYGTPLTIFHFEQEEDKSFAAYYRRYEDFFSIVCKNWSDQQKTRLLLRKLETSEHNKFADFILPRKTSELSFDEPVKLRTELFSPKISLFYKRWKCLNLTKNDEDDFATYAAVVNKHCDEFKLSELTTDNFKCLVFAQGLTSGRDAEIRRRVLIKLESEPSLTL